MGNFSSLNELSPQEEGGLILEISFLPYSSGDVSQTFFAFSGREKRRTALPTGQIQISLFALSLSP